MFHKLTSTKRNDIITRHKKVFLSKTSTCRDGTKPDGNTTTTRPHHPYILCRFANFAHHKTLCTLVYPHPVHNPHFTHINTYSTPRSAHSHLHYHCEAHSHSHYHCEAHSHLHSGCEAHSHLSYQCEACPYRS